MNPVITPDLLDALALTLAQGSFFQSPPALEEQGAGGAAALFERPALVGASLATLALVAFVLFNRREQAKVGALVAAGLLLLAGAGVAAGVLVETPRERVRALTRSLVEATGRADRAAVAGLLDAQVDLLMGGRRVPGDGRAMLLGALERLEGRYALQEAVVLETQVSLDADRRARTQTHIRAVPDGGGPSLSWWLLNWRQNAEGEWKATRIDGLLINGRAPGPSWMP